MVWRIGVGVIREKNQNQRSVIESNAIGRKCSRWNKWMRSGLLRRRNLTYRNNLT
jgi:hypothetical protein